MMDSGIQKTKGWNDLAFGRVRVDYHLLVRTAAIAVGKTRAEVERQLGAYQDASLANEPDRKSVV